MTDVHSHIIFGIDDGSSSLEESIQLLDKLKKHGFDNVIITPHFIEGSDYDAPNDIKRKRLNIIKEELKKKKIDINIYLGNEIFINDKIIELIKEDKISSLNNSKYILVELPFHNKINNLLDILYEFKIKGYIPIIAHPERYTYFQKDYSLVEELKNDGILFQSNYSSILGFYGSKAKKLIKRLIKDRYVDYLGTDIHHINNSDYIDNIDKIRKKIIKISNIEYYNEIMDNANKLLK